MVRRGQISLRAYNKANETTIQTLEEYYKIPQGKRNLDDIKESILTGVPLDKIKQKRKKAARQEQEQLNLFEDTTSGFVGGPALPMQSVQDLFDRLESMSAQTSAVDVVLNLNVESTTKNGNERLINDDTSIKMGDESQELNKLKRYGKTNYYINNGVLGVIIEGKDLFGRDGGSTKVNVKVPEGFDETVFAKLVAEIKYPNSTTPAETERVLNEIRDAIQKSITTNKPVIDKRTQSRIESLEFVINDYETAIIPDYQQERKDLVSQRNLASNPALVEKLNTLIAEYDDAIQKATQTVEDTRRELAKISEKIGKFVKEDTVSEESILDQLRKINSCFK
jgi:predicted transcriptional regulator